jgi:hypothetical protein
MSSGFYSQIINAPKRPKRAFWGRFGGVLGRFGRFVAFFGRFVAFFGRFVAFDAGPKKHHLFFDHAEIHCFRSISYEKSHPEKLST